jgi:aldehyde dehydrogenase (NAD+)
MEIFRQPPYPGKRTKDVPMTTDFGNILARQREYFMSGATLPYESRVDVLQRFGKSVVDHRQAIVAALRADLGKSEGEILMLELGPVLDGLQHTLTHLRTWMAPEELPSPPPLQPGRSTVRHEPLGVALIMAPWNYPVQLTFLPLVAALSAGNCAVLKPSPETPRVVDVMRRCLASAFGEQHVALVEGGVPESTALLRERFDAILYTGGARVGRIVMEAAAKHLTPVCLELGGKSPAVVAKDANLAVAARRIAWGKALNAGQTCIAPDYVLADETVLEEFLGLVSESFAVMVPDALANPDYARIISEASFDRLAAMLPEGARTDRAASKIAPVAFKAGKDHPAMNEEIFGPLLPVIPYSDPDEALSFVRNGERPLAFYIFTDNKALADKALTLVSSGGACVNDVLLHAASAEMPFGGVGTSGLGRYHGKYGFSFFSNVKSVLEQSSAVDMPFRYPPFGEETLTMLRSMSG